MRKFVTKTVFTLIAAISVAGLSVGAANAQPDINNPGSSNQFEKAVTYAKGYAFRSGGGSGISFHGGAVMTGQVTIYPIWYGAVSASTQTILTNFMSTIGGSPYFNINTSYTNGAGLKVSNTIKLGAGVSIPATSTQLSDSDIQGIVAGAIKSGQLPSDTNGIYPVITAPNITATSGFLTKYCGWHTKYALAAGGTIKYAFVGDPTAGMSACAAQTVSPNGNAPADAMVSVLVHELEEGVTDPELNAWFDNSGAENADKCAWLFGATSTLNSGAKYNVTINGVKYLIQQNWVNASGVGCRLAY